MDSGFRQNDGGGAFAGMTLAAAPRRGLSRRGLLTHPDPRGHDPFPERIMPIRRHSSGGWNPGDASKDWPNLTGKRPGKLVAPRGSLFDKVDLSGFQPALE